MARPARCITVTIDGADEIVGGATITGVANGTIGEDDLGIVVGDLDIDDPDIGEDKFQMPASLEGAFGTFTFDPDSGAWSYDLDNAQPAVQALKAGEILTDTLVVTSFDGTATQPVTVTITGVEDSAAITGTFTGNIGEDQAGFIVGDLGITDADGGDNKFQVPDSLQGAFGLFTFDAASGTWTYDVELDLGSCPGSECGRHADRHLDGDVA